MSNSATGRDYEQDISPHYLEQLNNLYEEWIERFDMSRC